LKGVAVPPGIRVNCTVVRNSHRFRLAASFAVIHSIGGEHRDVPLLEPGHGGSIQSGCLAGHVPRSQLRAASPAAGANQHNIAASDLDMRILFPRLQVEKRKALRKAVDYPMNERPR
jgi:hypothetical protein